jgi:hypothetical protein
MFNVVAGSDFSRVNGSAALPEFAMRPLQEDPRLRLRYLEPTPVITPGPARRGALVLSGPRVCADSFHTNGRLTLIAQFGAGSITSIRHSTTCAGLTLVPR